MIIIGKFIKLINKFISLFELALILSLVIHIRLITLGTEYFAFNEIEKNTNNIEYYQIEEFYFSISRQIAKDGKVVSDRNNEKADIENDNNETMVNYNDEMKINKENKTRLTKVNENKINNNVDNKEENELIIEDSTFEVENHMEDVNIIDSNTTEEKKPEANILPEEEIKLKKEENTIPVVTNNKKEDSNVKPTTMLSSDSTESIENNGNQNIIERTHIEDSRQSTEDYTRLEKTDNFSVSVVKESGQIMSEAHDDIDRGEYGDSISTNREEIENIDEDSKELISDSRSNGIDGKKAVDKNKETAIDIEKTKEEVQGSFENRQDNGPREGINTGNSGNNEEVESIRGETEEEQVNTLERIDLTNREIDNGIIPPEFLERKPAIYPENLRRRGIEGRVILKVLIDKEGNVIETIIAESSGFKEFDEKAVLAVVEWSFTPTTRNGSSVESWILLPVVFKLR